MPGMGTAATIDELNRLFAAMEDVTVREMEAAEKLNALRISNAEELAKLQLKLMTQNAEREADIRQRSYERAIKEGLDIIAVREREEHQLKLQEIDERLTRELALIDETDTAARAAAEARAADAKQRLVDEEKARRRDDEAYRKRQKKLDDA